MKERVHREWENEFMKGSVVIVNSYGGIIFSLDFFFLLISLL